MVVVHRPFFVLILGRGAIIIFALLVVLAAGVTPGIVKVLDDRERMRWERAGDIVLQVNTSDPVIALTFDDGPDRVYTRKILTILNSYSARATFFVIGKQVQMYPDIVRELVASGNEIGNHTFSHPKNCGRNASGLLDEIARANDAIYQAAGVLPSVFRPPFGFARNWVVEVCRNTGMKLVLWTWDEDTRDWTCPGARQIVNKVLKYAKPGSIVIFHDCGGDRTQTVAALPEILKGLAERGLHPVTVSELLGHDQYTPRPVQQSVDWRNMVE